MSRRRMLLVCALAGAITVVVASSASARPLAPNAAPGAYIVVFNDTVGSAAAVANEHAAENGFRHDHVYSHALKGYAAKLPAAAVERIKADPRVDYVEPDAVNQVQTTQVTPVGLWGLDRIDQRNLPLSGTYSYNTTASGVTAYIIDTGIRTTHVDFGGRAVSGFDAIDGGPADDCHGHGTHVAGTVGGTTYGVAKGVSLVAVRVLNCSGSGTESQVIAGIDWVAGNHAPGARAVANMSLGGGPQAALDAAVNNAIADGIVFAIAAGNSNANACNFSPARVAKALTVGATTITDARASFSNYGSCLDLLAPGTNVQSAWNTSDVATNVISGTSMATPHVAGIAARAWAAAPTSTASGVARRVKRQTTPGVITGLPAGTVNKLAYWPSTK